MPEQDLYGVLGVTKDASAQDVKKAFRALAKELHPDVAGNDPAKAARFREVATAYETLGDPDKRAAYDRMRTRRAQPRGRTWPGGFDFGGDQPRQRPPPPQGDLDLEDIFTDFNASDFGFGNRGPKGGPRTEPRPGRDITVGVDIPGHVATRGGTVTVSYTRLKRVESGSTLIRVDELTDLRIPPGTNHGDTLRLERMGDAGENGGVYGDLVADVHIVAGEDPFARRGDPRGGDPYGSSPRGGDPRGQDSRSGDPRGPDPRAGGPRGSAPPPWDPPPPSGPRMRFGGKSAGEPQEPAQVVDVTIGEAVLGGRIPVETPTGTVRIAIPAGTSSGTRFRVRGKGPPGPGGTPTDLLAEVRIVVPKDLDEESRRLIERFAELNAKVE
jgi:molecular chaperone DnaJ